MSVPLLKRGEQKLAVLKYSQEFTEYTFKLCYDSKRMPKKYRLSLVHKLANTSLEMLTLIAEANRVRVVDNDTYKMRINLLRKAQYKCASMEVLINLCANNLSLPKVNIDFWINKWNDVYKSLNSFLNNDLKRYEAYKE